VAAAHLLRKLADEANEAVPKATPAAAPAVPAADDAGQLEEALLS
jgi:hypothetical protein